METALPFEPKGPLSDFNKILDLPEEHRQEIINLLRQNLPKMKTVSELEDVMNMHNAWLEQADLAQKLATEGARMIDPSYTTEYARKNPYYSHLTDAGKSVGVINSVVQGHSREDVEKGLTKVEEYLGQQTPPKTE